MESLYRDKRCLFVNMSFPDGDQDSRHEREQLLLTTLQRPSTPCSDPISLATAADLINKFQRIQLGPLVQTARAFKMQTLCSEVRTRKYTNFFFFQKKNDKKL